MNTLLPPQVRDFYGTGAVELPYTQVEERLGAEAAQQGHPAVRTHEGVLMVAREFPEDLTPEDIKREMIEAASSIQQLKSGGYAFEIMISNLEKKENGIMLHFGTGRSSPTINDGNVYEFAMQLRRFPDMAHVYGTASGNGQNTLFTAPELIQMLRTGSMTQDEHGEIGPLPYFVHLDRALKEIGLEPTHINADQYGGDMAMGYGVAATENSIEAIQIDGPRTKRPDSTAYGPAAGKAAVLSKSMLSKISPDELRVNHPDIGNLGGFVLEGYRKAHPEARQLPAGSLRPRQIGKDMVRIPFQTLYERKGRQAHTWPADVSAFIERHPGILMSWIVTEPENAENAKEVHRAAVDDALSVRNLGRHGIKIVHLEGVPPNYRTSLPKLYFDITGKLLLRQES